MRSPAALLLAGYVALAAFCGCRSPDPASSSPSPSVAQAGAPPAASSPAKTARTVLEKERAEISEINPPTKAAYVAVQNANLWQNPFIVVGTHTLKVTVLMKDPNPAPMAASGALLRPTGARRTIQEIRTADLGEMLSVLPEAAWPYGRVVAVEESAQAARQDRVQMRRNYETTMQTLSSLGVVIDEWNEAGR